MGRAITPPMQRHWQTRPSESAVLAGSGDLNAEPLNLHVPFSYRHIPGTLDATVIETLSQQGVGHVTKIDAREL